MVKLAPVGNIGWDGAFAGVFAEDKEVGVRLAGEGLVEEFGQHSGRGEFQLDAGEA